MAAYICVLMESFFDASMNGILNLPCLWSTTWTWRPRDMCAWFVKVKPLISPRRCVFFPGHPHWPKKMLGKYGRVPLTNQLPSCSNCCLGMTSCARVVGNMPTFAIRSTGNFWSDRWEVMLQDGAQQVVHTVLQTPKKLLEICGHGIHTYCNNDTCYYITVYIYIYIYHVIYNIHRHIYIYTYICT